MVSSKAIKDRDDHLIPCAASPSGYVVPVAVIYGANASGKSNVVSGFNFLTDMILHSQTRLEPNAPIPRQPFMLDSEWGNRVTAADIDFLLDGVRYDYGFECTDGFFEAEYLNAFPKGRRVKLFERNQQDFEFGRSLKGSNAVTSEFVRQNSLFLSAAAQYEHVSLKVLYSFFGGCCIFSMLEVKPQDTNIIISGKHHELYLKVIDQIIGDIKGFHVSLKMVAKTETARILDSILENPVRYVRQNDGTFLLIPAETKNSGQCDSVALVRTGVSGEDVHWEMDHESSGTRRLIVLLHHAFKALEQGSLLIVDELDTSLHTQACEAIIALFSSKETNPKGAQLVATTHDTNLLRSALLRRDQIWFTEKDEGGATHLYPLSDFKVRNTDNLERGYLQGRFGAIPFAGSPLEIFGTGADGASSG